MNIKKMKSDVEDLIIEMKEEHKNCKNEDIKELMDSWDNIINQFRNISTYLEQYAMTEEAKGLIALMQELHNVRCFGKTKSEQTIEFEKNMQDEDFSDSWV